MTTPFKLPAISDRELMICFSHLRWNFVYQRPQHLMSRFAREYELLFLEEPVHDTDEPWLEKREEREGLTVLVPHLPVHCDANSIIKEQLDDHLAALGREPAILWYYTPMSIPVSEHLPRKLTVYDCMDELSAFRGAPAEMLLMERRLMERADIVFTGGISLYEAKRALHPNAHPFPSSVDVAHFSRARGAKAQPEDQASIPEPRLGFHGVIDERMDIELVEAVARARPDWHFVFVGPVVKIDPAMLPRLANIHWLGPRQYEELPVYLAGWNAAVMPFAMNESTRFISPTKTPEYLAGGKAVISTPVTDVKRGYGDNAAVYIAATPQEFEAAIQAALEMSPEEVCRHADGALADMSWDTTWGRMHELMLEARAAGRVDSGNARSVEGVGTSRARAAGQRKQHYDVLVVGAGFAGSVMAERMAGGSGKRVLVIDKRPHIGGNAYDCLDEAGILFHKYGPHIFHTNSDLVVEYLSRFTEWRPYEHQVLAEVDGMQVPIPINLNTLEALYGRSFTEDEARDFLKAQAVDVGEIRTSEDVVLSTVGRDLYEKFFRGYTTKQWGLDPSRLDKSVTARIPTRTNRDNRYFTDAFQCMPLHGYTRMFERMLEHPNIDIRLGCDFATVREEIEYDHLVYTGPVDQYFGYSKGRLPYRSLRFEHVTVDTPQHQPVAVVNYPSEDVPYTRVTEYRHLTGQPHTRTSLTYEYPSAEGDPYYPIPCPESQTMREAYEALADQEPNVTFLGRLGTYRYYNMDQVVAQALAEYAKLEGLEGLRGAIEESAAETPLAKTA